MLHARKEVSSIPVPLPPRLYHRFVRPKWVTRAYIHRPIAAFVDLRGKRVLDFGCGTGANCAIIDEPNYVGVDPDRRRIEYASRRYPKRDFRVMSEGLLQLDGEQFDVIMIVAVLHHVDNERIERYLQEFRRCLKPSGSIIAMEPYVCAKHPVCSAFMKAYDKGEFIRDAEGYLALFRSNRFSCNVIRTFRKCLMYRELFFEAKPL